jgi:hypothetical protein
MMNHKTLLVLGLLFLLAGCASRSFVLTDRSAMEKLMSTQYVADLQRGNASALMCFVEGSAPDARELYLGEDHPDHTVRLRACRVTADGRVWVNDDPTMLEERWRAVE